MRAGAPHGTTGLPPPSPTRECQQREPGPLIPARSLCPLPVPSLGGGHSGLPRGTVVELGGHSAQEGKGPGHSCFENLFGLGIRETWGREMVGGDMGTLAFDRVFVKSPKPRSGIRFPWTQCAPGGKGSRLSSPRHVGGWVCWHPLRPRVHAAAAPAAGCAGTSPRSSAAAASGTR